MKISAQHATIINYPDEYILGHFAWPTLCRTITGELLLAASGFRNRHICPFGLTTLFTSTDDGESWSGPEFINKCTVDVRDAGIIALPDGNVLLSYFTSDTRRYYPDRCWETPFYPILDSWKSEDEKIASEVGSFLRLRRRNGKWDAPVNIPITAPHGPVTLQDRSLFYLGAEYNPVSSTNDSGVTAMQSFNDGLNWHKLGSIPNPARGFFCEPHSIQLQDGRILGMLRYEPDFDLYQVYSSDGGRSWSRPRRICNGAPPHLMRHSSGTLICSYANRADRGEGTTNDIRLILSDDDGKNWSRPLILRNDAPNWDLGYPSTVERRDGKLLTAYYQCFSENKINTGLGDSIWRLEDAWELQPQLRTDGNHCCRSY